MKFTKVSETVYKTESQSREGTFHYIGLFENPMYGLIMEIIRTLDDMVDVYAPDVKRVRTLITCTCESFRMGIPRGGGNPFIEGCVHVKAFKNRKKKAKKKGKRNE